MPNHRSPLVLFAPLAVVLACLLLRLPSAGAQNASFADAPLSHLVLPEGFVADLVVDVSARKLGSWVSMTLDRSGRLIASDQYGRLYRVTPAAVGKPESASAVELIDTGVGEAQGMLASENGLYVVSNGKASGLYLLSDTDGDDTYDEETKLLSLQGNGEHGPHAIVSRGGQKYIIAGNHTKLPPVSGSMLKGPHVEDLLLPRMWDARGHATGILAPGGWIARLNDDAAPTLYCAGFRNAYDLVVGPDGELFTYDADMEWDVGTPWYRPTRVNHVVSGGEFGWRSGTGKWPAWYPDSLPAVVDIGPGSPTGVVYGEGLQFPTRYQRALFIADWSYGIVYSVHLTPEGASFVGEATPFLSGTPLPVTDLVVDPSAGCLYFSVGGRRATSAVYRVRYLGAESKAPPTEDLANGTLRAERRRLEAFHGRIDPEAVAKAWPYLSHEDRHLRFAARVAVEHQPIATWRERFVKESDADAVIQGAMAVARQGTAEDEPLIIRKLVPLTTASLSMRQRRDLARAFSLTFARLGIEKTDVREVARKALLPLFPSGDRDLDGELSQLLIALEEPSVISGALALQAKAPTQEEQLHYALILRTARAGWTPPLRQRYFQWFQDAASLRGGMSFSGFIGNIRKEAIALLSDDEKRELGALLGPLPTRPALARDPGRKVVAEWTLPVLAAQLRDGLSHRDRDNGQRMFATASCYKCHRFAGEGGTLGPDLTGVGGRFGTEDLLRAIIEPNHEISDQYRTTSFWMKDGAILDGRVVNVVGDQLLICTDMMDPSKIDRVKRSEIDEMRVSATSQMPTGLLDTLTAEEIKDLLAYLMSRGDPKHPVFR